MSGHAQGSWWHFEDILEVGINPEDKIVFRLQWKGLNPDTGKAWDTHQWTLLRDMPSEAIEHHTWRTFEKTTQYKNFMQTHPQECPIPPHWPLEQSDGDSNDINAEEERVEEAPVIPPLKKARLGVEDAFDEVCRIAHGRGFHEAINVFTSHAKALDRYRPKNWRLSMVKIVAEIQHLVRTECVLGKRRLLREWVHTMEDNCRPDMIFINNVERWLIPIVKQEIAKNKQVPTASQ